MMRKQGNLSIFLQKYIYGIKTIIPIVIGLSKYNGKKFLIFNFFASIIWALVIGISAYVLGEVVIETFDKFKYYSLLIIVVFFGVIWYFVNTSTKK